VNTISNIGDMELVRSLTGSFLDSVSIAAIPRRVGGFMVDDTDVAIQNKTSTYWVRVINFDATYEDDYGPVTATLNIVPPVIPPANPFDFIDVCEEPINAVSVRITTAAQVSAAVNFRYLRLFAYGYLGDNNWRLIAQSDKRRLSVILKKTGEVVKFRSTVLNETGESDITVAPETIRTLDGVLTIPCRPLDTMWLKASDAVLRMQGSLVLDPDPTSVKSYAIYEGPIGGGFGAAAITTANAKRPANGSALALGLTRDPAVFIPGNYEWYICSANDAGLCIPLGPYVW
jgi:hypothetical protein